MHEFAICPDLIKEVFFACWIQTLGDATSEWQVKTLRKKREPLHRQSWRHLLYFFPWFYFHGKHQHMDHSSAGSHELDDFQKGDEHT